jgi:zinc-ribbon domain
MSNRTCRQCGASLLANQRFCTNCGATADIAPGILADSASDGGNFLQVPPPLSFGGVQGPQPSQFPGVPSVRGTPSIPQHVQPHSLAGQPGQIAQSAPGAANYAAGHGQPSFPQQGQPHSFAGQPAQPAQFAQSAQPAPAHSLPGQGQPPVFHAPSAPPPQVRPPVPGQHALPAPPSLPGAGSAAKRAGHMGLHLLMKKPLVTLLAAVVIIGGGAGFAYYSYQSTAPSSFVIATDRGNNQIDRIDLATRSVSVLLSNKVLPGSDSPDSVIFLNNTQMLIDFINSGEIGIGDIQQHTYKSLGAGHGSTLRDMALRPDGSSVLVSDQSGNILEFHTDTQKITTFTQNLGGVQGLAFDSNGNLYAAAGGQVIQLDPATGKQLKTFTLPGGSDGMAYDGRHHTLDIAVGSTILALNTQTGQTSILIDGISTPDGLAIDRQGNLYIADNIGVLELTTNNQLLIVGTDTNGIAWDDVAPLSGAGAASY